MELPLLLFVSAYVSGKTDSFFTTEQTKREGEQIMRCIFGRGIRKAGAIALAALIAFGLVLQIPVTAHALAPIVLIDYPRNESMEPAGPTSNVRVQVRLRLPEDVVSGMDPNWYNPTSILAKNSKDEIIFYKCYTCPDPGYCVTTGNAWITDAFIPFEKPGIYTIWVYTNYPGADWDKAVVYAYDPSSDLWIADDYLLAYQGSAKSVTIPKSVKRIKNDAFFDKELTRVTLPEGLKEMGDGCFRQSGLTEVTIPDSVTTMGNNVFYYCRSLKKATIGKGLKALPEGTFVRSGLTSVTIPETITEIGYLCFGGSDSLTSVTLPKTLKKIGVYAFEGCSKLKSLTIPPSVTSIGEDAFANCAADFKLTVTAGSYAEKYAKQYKIPYTAVGGKTDISKAKITDVKDQTYTGKAVKPAVTVKLNGKQLKEGTDYKVAYANNVKIGKATVTVTGTGKYEGKATASFSIVPGKVKISALKAGKKKLTVTWAKMKGITGYEIQYSLKKSFKNAKTIVVSKASAKKTVIKKLKSKKTYYVRIRAFGTADGVRYYSVWSKILKKKVK